MLLFNKNLKDFSIIAMSSKYQIPSPKLRNCYKIIIETSVTFNIKLTKSSTAAISDKYLHQN